MPAVDCDGKSYERVPEDSPERCQATTAKGQCRIKRAPGSNYCPIHTGQSSITVRNAKAVRSYLLDKFHSRVAAMTDSTYLKDLRAEIGITRMLLENKLNSCANNNELLINAPAISDMTLKIEKLVTSCTKLEAQLGKSLDESQLIKFVDTIIETLSAHLSADLLKTISEEIQTNLAAIAMEGPQ